MNVCIRNRSGEEVSLQTFVRKDLDENTLQLLVFSANELQGSARSELLLNDPAASEPESDSDRVRIP